ncbi:MAG: hypothetical protein BWY54_00064 [Candidatus Dependentiae bacterium ADurb.Bin331]|nr:MAG: hypothetical protein BWY54_00064 [Candidatus Dependentiae bacterium ADurb.Bin331]
MKKLLSALVLSSSFITAFAAKLDVSFSLNENSFLQSASFDENQPSVLSFESDFALIELTVEANDEKVMIAGQVFAKTENGSSLISQPVIEATFNNAATITVAANDESNSAYSLTVTASKE